MSSSSSPRRPRSLLEAATEGVRDGEDEESDKQQVSDKTSCGRRYS